MTHAHPDHASCLNAAKKRYSAKVFAHGGRTGWRESMFSVDIDSAIDTMIGDSDEVLGYKVIGTPGHTSDHLAFYLPGILFSGDALQIKEGRLCFAPRIFNTDHKKAEDSYNLLAELPCELICPGHKEPFVLNS